MPAKDPLLHADNHELFNHVRLRLVARDPVITWEEIADEFCVEDVNEFIAWFLSYRLPPALKTRPMPDGVQLPRDPSLRAEYLRLRERESSLVTVASEAPRQLVTVQRRMASLERSR